MSAPVIIENRKTVPVDVKNAPDTELLSRTMFEVSLKHLFPCVQAKGGQPTDANMQACFCENKTDIENKIKVMDGVLDKHPDWRGNIIHFTDSEKTELWLEVFNVDLFKANIANCK